MGSKALTIDGRPWEYRDPKNKKYNEQYRADRRGDDGSAEDNRNRHSYKWTNELYDYSKGQVKDAAKALGIGNVDEKKEVRKILKYIREGGSKKEQKPPKAEPEKTPAPAPTPAPPPPPRGSTFTEDTKTFEETRLQRPENQAPRQTFTEGPGGPGITEGPGAAQRDAVRAGEDLNEYFTNQFIPSLQADARLTAQEIGESGRYNLNRFIGKVPELGDPKDLFEYYSDKIKGKDKGKDD